MSDTSIVQSNFWSGKVASDALEAGTMSKDLKFRYYFIFVIASVLLIEFINFVNTVEELSYVYNRYDALTSLGMIVITLVAVRYFYKNYTGTASFIEKMIIVSVASAPWIFICSFLVMIPFFALDFTVYPDATESTVFSAAGLLASQLCWYYMLQKYFVTK